MPFRSLKYLGRPFGFAALYQAFVLFWAGVAGWMCAWMGWEVSFEFFLIAASFVGFFIAFCDREVDRNEMTEAGHGR